ncbi:hypothetical protein CLOACE_13610 [Clostridium acetireducens DSM 10703]|uniref:Uncharacterized protein n=1 Tax=Clostridium acetireducens DSM 10703 TaxID=1121290 RepID=A0A1E8EYD5_9CLOT|nr:hypothetical protein [Clostridium acetireducens]OFI05980.1 hypothetical protein CLOACE_13610 [Clostridium acetireducens DSM 10703]
MFSEYDNKCINDIQLKTGLNKNEVKKYYESNERDIEKTLKYIQKNDINMYTIINATMNTEQLKRYGSAASEYIKGYSGTYDGNNNLIKKGLKQISESKVNEKFKYQNLKQQAGFSAEVDYVSKTNAENIINKNNSRISRSNDVGRGNDTRFDVVAVDINGNVVLDGQDPKWGAQMKFCGAYQTADEIKRRSENLVKKLVHPKWDRYRNNDILIPKEQYSVAKNFAEKKAKELFDESSKQKQLGNLHKSIELEQQAQKYQKVSKNIKDSGITSREAMFLREYPKLATVKNVAKISHRCGIEQAKGVAIISGTLSVSRNVVYIMRGEKEISEALYDSAVDVAKGSVLGYITGASDTAIRGFMASSSNSVFVNLSKTSFPSMIASTTLQVVNSIKKYAKGELDEIELVEELGEKGTGMLAASLGAAVGTAILPGIGTAVGGMIGYMTSSSIYNASMKVLNEVRIAKERYETIHSLCMASIESMQEERKKFEVFIDKYFKNRQAIFENSFNTMDAAIKNNDVNLFTQDLNNIAIQFGSTLQFKNFDQFDRFMQDDTSSLEF